MIMKRFKILFILPLFVTVFHSCDDPFSVDDYLGIEPKGQVVVSTLEQMEQMLQHPDMFTFSNNVLQTLVTERDYLDPVSTLQMRPFVRIHYLWEDGPGAASRYDHHLSDGYYNRLYQGISRHNIILDNLPDVEGSQEVKRRLQSEVRMLRAYNYFVLINTYAKHYDASSAAQDPGIPLSTEFNLEASPAQVSVQKIYDFILEEIDASLPHLPDYPSDNILPGKAFGYAFKAKVLLFMKRWDDALEAANESLKYTDALYDLVQYYQENMAKVPVVAAWPHVDRQIEENIFFRATDAWDFTVYSLDRIAKFDEGDTRLLSFFMEEPGLFPDGRMFMPSSTMGMRGLNMGGMKVSEVYLMRAELYARSGDIQRAMQDVAYIREHRILPEHYDPDEYTSVNTRAEAMDIIIRERENELQLTFNRFWDLRRLNTEPEYQTTLTKEYDGQTYTLEPDSYLYIYPFSQQVLDYNPELKINTDK